MCGSPSPSLVQLPPRIQGSTGGGQCRGPDDHGHSGTHYASDPWRGEPGSVSQSRIKVPDPLSDVQSLQNYFPTSGLTTTGPGCLAFSPVYPRGPQRRVTFSFASSANDVIQI